MMNNDNLAIQKKTDKVKKNPFKQMTLALPIETDRQNLLAGLRHSSLVRDDSGNIEFIGMKKKENIIQ